MFDSIYATISCGLALSAENIEGLTGPGFDPSISDWWSTIIVPEQLAIAISSLHINNDII